jgi:hypothetical protein
MIRARKQPEHASDQATLLLDARDRRRWLRKRGHRRLNHGVVAHDRGRADRALLGVLDRLRL